MDYLFFSKKVVFFNNNVHSVGTHNINIIEPTPKQQYNNYFQNRINILSVTNTTVDCKYVN